MVPPPPVVECYIRSTHHYGFRSGQWAKIVDFGWHDGADRPCFVVEFIDGKRDEWPYEDDSAGYEFGKVAQ